MENNTEINGMVEDVTKDAMNRLRYIANGNAAWTDMVEQEVIEELEALGHFYNLDAITVNTPFGEFSPTATVARNVGLTLNFENPESFVNELEEKFTKLAADAVGDNPGSEARIVALFHYMEFLNMDDKWSNELQEKIINELKVIDYRDETLLRRMKIRINPLGCLSMSLMIKVPIKMEGFWPTPGDFREQLNWCAEETFKEEA